MYPSCKYAENLAGKTRHSMPETRMQGCDAPSARPKSTRMMKNCVVLWIAAHHGKKLVSHTCGIPCPWAGKEPVHKGVSG